MTTSLEGTGETGALKQQYAEQNQRGWIHWRVYLPGKLQRSLVNFHCSTHTNLCGRAFAHIKKCDQLFISVIHFWTEKHFFPHNHDWLCYIWICCSFFFWWCWCSTAVIVWIRITYWWIARTFFFFLRRSWFLCVTLDDSIMKPTISVILREIFPQLMDGNLEQPFICFLPQAESSKTGGQSSLLFSELS